MKFNLFRKTAFFILLSLISLEASEALSLKLQNQITNNLAQNLEKKFDGYSKKIESEKQNALDNLAFSNLYNNDLSYTNISIVERSFVKNDK